MAPRSTSGPVGPRYPPSLVFGSSDGPMGVLVPQKCPGVHGRVQKLCRLIFKLSMQPCIDSGTLSLGKRASWTVKVFSRFWIQVWFSGDPRDSRAATNTHSSSKNRVSCAAHVLPRTNGCGCGPGGDAGWQFRLKDIKDAHVLSASATRARSWGVREGGPSPFSTSVLFLEKIDYNAPAVPTPPCRS